MRIVKTEAGVFIHNDSDELVKKISSEMTVDYLNEKELMAYNAYDKIRIVYEPGVSGSEVLLQPEGSTTATPFSGTIRELLQELGENFFKLADSGSVDLSAYSTTLQMDAAIAQAKDDLLGGAGPAYDTLLELQQELQADDIVINGILTSLGNKRDTLAQKNSIVDDAGDLQLEGDSAAPGINFYYGTNGLGAKGFNKLFTRQRLNFSGRYYLYNNNRWVGTRNNWGVGTDNQNQNFGTGATPNVIWNNLGIGFLPAGAVLKRMVFYGRTNNAQVDDIEVHLSKQGDSLTTGGFDSNGEADNVEVLPVTALNGSAPNMNDIQSWEVSLGDHVLTKDRCIIFACRPVGNLTGTRYWYVNAYLEYEIKY